MGVPRAEAQVIYNPVTQFYTQAPLNGNATAVQSGSNGWYYQYSASSASFGAPGSNVGANTLLTRTYNQAAYQNVVNSDANAPTYALYSLWAYNGATTAGAPMIYERAGRLGLNVAGSLPGSAWGATILTWQAPSAGTVDVSYAVSATTNAAGGGAEDTIYAEVDLWNGTSVVNVAARQGILVGNSTTFTATGVNVNAGDEIQFWRDGYANQQGTVLLDGTLTFNAIPEPSTWAMLAIGLTTVMVLRRRRSLA